MSTNELKHIMIERLALLLTRGYRFFETFIHSGGSGKCKQESPEYYLSMVFIFPLIIYIYIDFFDVSVGPGHYEDK